MYIISGVHSCIKMASDPFVRQRSVPGWNVHVIHNQTALLLGVGGIGCTVALALWSVPINSFSLLFTFMASSFACLRLSIYIMHLSVNACLLISLFKLINVI